ncbi:hypothetical protein HYU07_03305 [Candidatus Woesearchaeota archaeon]|nr:hypothetical protein [Candidatus Woesearchaeota archaeon]
MFVSFVFGANSPSEIWDFNSDAKEILIGSIVNIGLPPVSWNLTVNKGIENKYFELGIIQVRKTSSNLTERRIIKIPFYHFLLPVSGGKEVIVDKGELVKIYANPTTIDEDVFELAISGDSIIRLKSLNDSSIEEVSKDCFVYRGSLVVHFKEGTTEKQTHNILWKPHVASPSSPLDPLNLSYMVYFTRNSTYSDIKKYADDSQKEGIVEDVRLQNHNVSCYPDYSENFEKILTEEVKYERIDAIGTIHCLKGCIFRYSNTSNTIFSSNDQIKRFAESNQTVRITGELTVRDWCGQERWETMQQPCRQHLLDIYSLIPISSPEEPEIKEEKQIDKISKEPASSIFQKIWKHILNLFK